MKLFDIQKYLKKNPSAGCDIIRSCGGFFTFAVIVPMLNENDNAERFFNSLAASVTAAPNENILIIAVVNCHERSSAEYKKDNFELLKRLHNNEFKLQNLAIFDHTSEGKTLRNGVGEARKIGMDFALREFDSNDFENSIIASLDADTLTYENYFTEIRRKFNALPEAGAITFNVRHADDAEDRIALAQYEKYMQSYCEGLKKAGSPYAFYTVGSAFAVRASDYIRSGGMRKLKAGEDFYFLQAVVKSSKVIHCPDITVRPSARFSARVPFGTGTALRAISDNVKEYLPFPEKSFDALGEVIAAADAGNLSSAEKFLSSISEENSRFFIEAGFIEDWAKVTSNLPSDQLRNAFLLHWFDGLKTLQFIKSIK